MFKHTSLFRLALVSLALGFSACTVSCAGGTDEPLATRAQPIWSPFGRPAKDTPSKQLAYAESLRATNPKKAGKQFRALVKRWPGAPQAAEAQKAYADLLRLRGKHFKAFGEYEDLLDRYAGDFAGYDEVLATEFEMARYIMERRKGTFMFLPGFTAPEEALPLLESVVKNGPQSAYAAEAQYLIGDILETTDKYEEALMAYEKGQHAYAATPFALKCAFGRARTLCLLADEKQQDMAAQKQAYAALTLFLNAYPDSDRAEVAREYQKTLRRRLARAAYDKAVFYEKVARKPSAALMAYKQFVREHPSSEWTGVAEIRIDALSRTVKGNDEE